MDILSLIKNNPGIETYEVAKSLAATSYIEEALIIAASYRKNPRNITLAALNLYEAQRLYERLATLLSDDECALFSVEESLRVSMIAASPETKATMVETLYKIRQGKPMVIVTHTAALVRHLPRPEYFDSRCISLKLDDEISMNELKEELLKSGYTQVSHIDQPLTFAMRGGIVDVYSMNYDHPIRIEFFDTIVDSIRFFDIDTQKTIKQTNNIVIIPASEILFDEQEIELIKTRVNALLKEKNDPTLESEIEIDLQYIENYVFENKLYLYFAYLDRTGSLLDYIGKSEIVLRKAQVEDHYKHLIEDNVAYIQEMSQEKKVLPRFAVYKDLSRILDHKLLIEVDPFADNLSEINEVHLPKEPIEMLVRMIKDHYEGYKILFSLRDYEVEKITKTCIEQEVPYELMPENPVEGINLYFEFIFEGFEAVKEKVVVITSAELFEVKTRMSRYANKFKHAEVLQNYNDLNPGDYVVHQQYGVGQYMGIET
ncbi:MAG: transcription-repair coupling factor, partial [Erysipelotrichaceae bacterium]|nr:transcription-repair coupling factor [Erysipelotrichaceae bacterium]